MWKIDMSEIAPTTTLHLSLMELYFAFIPSAGRKAVPIGLFAVFAVFFYIVLIEIDGVMRTPHASCVLIFV